ncbi:MAG TPA: hypothetical protein VF665_04010 [Longimicrobium sp.]
MPRSSLLLLAAVWMAGGCRDARSAEPGAPVDDMRRAERKALAGQIIFVSERDGQAEVYAVRADGSDPRRLTNSASADYPGAVSPDGRALLVVSVSGDDKNTTERMALLPLDGNGRARSLGPVSARVRSPAWSPDGSWIVFESDTASFRDLYRMRRDGSGLQRLTDNPQGNYDPAVSPDGEWIAFVSSRDGDAEIYRMRMDGSGVQRLTAFHTDDWAPRWSPDGRRIAFISNRGGRDRVYLVGADGVGFRALNTAADTAQEAEPAWSPDGTRVAHTIRAGEGSRIAVTDLRTGRRAVISPAGESASAPAWSPNGRHIAYTASRGAESDIRVVRSDGGASFTLVRTPGADWLPRWIR